MYREQLLRANTQRQEQMVKPEQPQQRKERYTVQNINDVLYIDQ